jgi:hypothetical protein
MPFLLDLTSLGQRSFGTIMMPFLLDLTSLGQRSFGTINSAVTIFKKTFSFRV